MLSARGRLASSAMSSYNPSYLYSRLRETIPAALPWNSGDPNVKGDPRKTVKWIDVWMTVPPSMYPVQYRLSTSLWCGSPPR